MIIYPPSSSSEIYNTAVREEVIKNGSLLGHILNIREKEVEPFMLPLLYFRIFLLQDLPAQYDDDDDDGPCFDGR